MVAAQALPLVLLFVAQTSLMGKMIYIYYLPSTILFGVDRDTPPEFMSVCADRDCAAQASCIVGVFCTACDEPPVGSVVGRAPNGRSGGAGRILYAMGVVHCASNVQSV